MYKVKIFGAGSIGNHLANAFVTKGHKVILSDVDNKALERSRNETYISRYGSWSENITLMLSDEIYDIDSDIVFIGTPPEFHIPIAIKVLESNAPKLILIEKPLCTPDLSDLFILKELAFKKGVEICVGYNHIVSEAAKYIEKYLNKESLGEIQHISSYTREHWGGIFKAHPWLSGPADSYLGYYLKGGGSLSEHSHGLNMWQNLCHKVGGGKIVEVSSKMDFVNDGIINYDKCIIASFTTENGLSGDLIQDVLTFPANKSSKVIGTDAFVEIILSSNNSDIINYGKLEDTKVYETVFSKKRADDFIWEVNHLENILSGGIKNNDISLERGIETMIVISAIIKSNQLKRTVVINWSNQTIN